jgi:hypothetical protein
VTGVQTCALPIYPGNFPATGTRCVHHYSRHFETKKVTGPFFGFGIICVFGMYAILGLAM